MIPWLSGMILTMYYLVLGLLAAFGIHRLFLVVSYLRASRRPLDPPQAPGEWPMVTVQLPIFNEMYVAPRLIDAVCALDYPRDRLEIQVLDDSTDETAQHVANQVAALRAAGHAIRHLHRRDRTGYKAGALAAGQEVAKGDLIAIFDADFVPASDFLKKAVPHFSDPEIGMVQARWGHINRDYSLLTRIQAILLDGHFVVEHTARHASGCFFNFNGTAGIWRRQTVEDAGGWQHDTLTEDLDLSYRAQLAGWRFHYLPDLVVPAELPVEVGAFKSQQHRWAKGSIQTGRKLLGRILRTRLPLRAKLEAIVHMTANVSYPLMILLSLLIFPAMVLRSQDEAWTLLAIDLPLFVGATLSVVAFYLASQMRARGGLRRALRDLPALMGLGVGLAVNNTRAVLSGLRERGGVFHRTPKYRIEGRAGDWKSKRYLRPTDRSLAVEGLLATYLAACFTAAVLWQMWACLPFLSLFLYGYVYMTFLGLAPVAARLTPRAA